MNFLGKKQNDQKTEERDLKESLLDSNVQPLSVRTGSGGGRLCLCTAVEPRLLFHILGPEGLDERVGMVTGLLTFSFCRLPGDRELGGGGVRSWALS